MSDLDGSTFSYDIESNIESFQGGEGGGGGGISETDSQTDVEGVDDVVDKTSSAQRALYAFDGITATSNIHQTGADEVQDAVDSAQSSLNVFDGTVATSEVDTEVDEEPMETAQDQVKGVQKTFQDFTDTETEDWVQGIKEVTEEGSSIQSALYAFDDITATSSIRQQGADEVQDAANSAQSSLNEFDGTVATAQMNVETDDDEEVQEQVKGVQQTFDDFEDSESGISLPGDRSSNLRAAFQRGVPDFIPGIQQKVQREEGTVDLSGLFDTNILSQMGTYSLPGVFGGGEEDIELTEARESVRELGSGIRSLPDHRLDIGSRAELEEYRYQLQESNQVADSLSETLGGFDDDVGDSILQQSESIEMLRRNLQKTERDTERLDSNLGRLEGASRDLVSSMISQSQTTEELDERTDRLGSRAKRTAKSIASLSSTVAGYVVSASRGADSSEEFVDELQDVGAQALKTRLKVSAVSGSVQDFVESISNIGTSFGPFATTLGSVTRWLPVLGSLIAALGGVATAGGAAGGVLAGIFGGGLLKAGEQMADTLEATGQASEELRKAEGAQRAMLGLEKIMGRLREKAYDALEPLRQPEFAQFSLDVLNGAVELLGRLAKTAASLSEPVLGWADDIGNAFWATLPAILEEVEKSMLAIGPILRDLAVGAIEALPGILALMRRHAEKLLPPLMDIGDAFMDALPGILAFGQGMLQLILPIVEGALKGIAAISPVLRALGGLFSWLANSIVVGPILEFVGAILGIGAVASMIPGLGALFSLLVKIGGLLSGSGVLAGMSFSGLGLSGLLGPLGVIIALVGVLLTLFNKWDNALKWLAKGWNGLLDVVEGVMQGMMKAFGKAINKMISFAPDWLVGKQKKKELKINLDNIGKLDYSDYKVDPQKASKFGKKLNSPIKSAKSALGMGQKKTPTPQQKGGEGSRNLGGDTYNQQTQNIVDNVTVNGSGNEARVESAVRRGVKQANKRQRMRNTDMNS